MPVITKTQAVSPGYLYSVTTDSTCIITDVATRYNLCKAVVNKQGMFVAIGGSVECSDGNAVLTQASTVSGGTRFEVVTTRPEIGETGVIYLVPASNSTTENLYEEWVWVDDKWEQIGSAGLNLSNYAQLTTSNTFSAANTFNGNLIKKTSSSLADNSVLNRSEMDSRYGKLSGGNSWQGNQTVNGKLGSTSLGVSGIISLDEPLNHGPVGLSAMKAITIGSDLVATRDAEIKGNLRVYGSSGICIHSVSGLLELNQLDSWRNSEGQKNSCIQVLTSLHLHKHDLKGVHIGYIDTLYVDNISSVNSLIPVGCSIHLDDNNITRVNRFEAKSMHLSGGATMMGTLTASNINTSGGNLYINTPGGHTAFMHDVNAYGSVNVWGGMSIVGNLGVAGRLTAGSEKNTIDVYANLHMQGKDIKKVSNISSPNGVSLGIKSSIHAYGHSIYEADAVKLARLGASSLSTTPGRIDVEGSLHFPLGNGSYVDPDVVIANAELRAVNLSSMFGAPDKYGIRITNTSCQLFGTDFIFGDAWTKAHDYAIANNNTITYPLAAPTSLELIKVMKPGVAIATEDKGYLSFDYAKQVYIRTFPSDGGQALFEFQGGHWTDDHHNNVKLGAVDIRKADASTLHPQSLLNMAEGDARWGGGGSGSDTVLVDSKLTDTSFMATELRAVDAVGTDESAYGIAIGPGITANVYRDIAIGGWINTEDGRGDNTLLGYGFYLQNGARKNIIIGHGGATAIYSSNTIVIGDSHSSSINSSNAIAISGDLGGDEAVAINGTAENKAVAIGSSSYANANAVAIGAGSLAALDGTALGAYSIASENKLVLQAGNVPAISMQLYSGKSWETRNDTGYLRFVTSKLRENIDNPSASNWEEIIIHKKPLWDAIQRAKDYNYPAQPFVSLVGDNGEVPPALANAQPNTIYHIVVGAMDIDLTDMMFDTSIPGIASAELHFEIPSGTTPFVVWPDIMIWPDEADPTVAPTLSGAASGNKLYAIVVRKQVTTAGEFLVASVAYSFEY